MPQYTEKQLQKVIGHANISKNDFWILRILWIPWISRGFCTTRYIKLWILWILHDAIHEIPDFGILDLPTLHALTYVYVLDTSLHFPGALCHQQY